MKTLITAAVLVAIPFAASAQTLEEAVAKAVDTYMSETAAKGSTPTANGIGSVSASAAQDWYNSVENEEVNNLEHQLDDTQDTADFYQREFVEDEEEIVELKQANVDANAEAVAQAQIIGDKLNDALSNIVAMDTEITQAGNKAHVEFGDIYNGGAKYSEYFSDASYDRGKVWANITPPDNEGGKPILQQVVSVDVVGKYHNFAIGTDVWLYNNDETTANFSTLLKNLKNLAYDEAYKDGFNDGYEVGYNDGWHDAIQSLQ